MNLLTYSPPALSTNTLQTFTGDPAAAEDSSGNVYVIARDTSPNGALWANMFVPGSGWSGWHNGGGVFQCVPAIASNGVTWIAARDSYNSYWINSYSPSAGWGTWFSLSGVFATDPAIAVCGDGSVYVAGRDGSNALWTGHYTSGSGVSWAAGGGVIQQKPSVACSSDNNAYVVARDAYNSNWMATFSGGLLTAWFNGGAITAVDPKIAYLNGGSMVVVIVDSTGAVWGNIFYQGAGSRWQTWNSIGGVMQDVSPASVNGSLYLAGRDTYGTVWWWKESGNVWTNTGAISAGPVSAAGASGMINISSGMGALDDFRTCIGPNGNAQFQTCMLAPGRYTVVPSAAGDDLIVGRSNIIITGGGGPGDTILVRGDSSIKTIMIPLSASITNVTIENLTFDGNRYGAGLGLNCMAGNNDYSDLDLDFGPPGPQGTFTVQWVDFVNAPGDAPDLGGGSTVSLSNFGQGGTVSATRSTAIFIDGNGNGAWYNAISYAGTAAITLNGSSQYAYGNWLIQNRYEMSDVSPSGTLQQGGQLVLTPTSTNASVAANVINGSNWPMGPGGKGTGPPYIPLDTGCTLGSGSAFNPGVEALGIGHGFYNNEVYQNTGAGMTLASTKTPAEQTGQIYISSSNPWDSSDMTRLIEGNAHGGIDFCGPAENSSCVSPAVGVILDDVLVENNAGYGVSLSNVSYYFGPTNYLGFINAAGYRSACLTGNTGVVGDPITDTNTHVPTTLPYAVPLNDADFHGSHCPTSGVKAPALSHIPGWKW